MKRSGAQLAAGIGEYVRLQRLRRFVRKVRAGERRLGDPATLQQLRRLWANEASTAGVGYLQEIVSRLSGCSAVLECGSGLSTFVVQLAVAVGQRETIHVALEDHPQWRERLRRRLRACGLPDDCVVHAPLTPARGGERWYDTRFVPGRDLFDLVICDGPRAQLVEHGRAALLVNVGDRMRPGAVVLLDDVDREGEQEALSRWQESHGAMVVDVVSEPEVGKAFAIVEIP